MKKYKSIVFALSILILMTFSIPQLTLASWWNPFSWFKKEVKIEQPIQIPVVPPEVVSILEKNIEKEIKKESKVVETKKVNIPVIKEEVKESITPVVEAVKENYKLGDVIKEWRPYVVRVTCITLDVQGNKKSYSDGSGLLSNNPKTGPAILTNKHVFSLHDGTPTNYCDVYFPGNGEIVRVEKKDRYSSNKGYDKGALFINQPSEYIKDLIKNSQLTSTDCKNTKPDSTDDIVIMGYPKGQPKNDISYATGKIVGYLDNYYISSATIIEGYSGGVAVSLKDNCYLGIPTYAKKDDETKSLILDINKF